MNYDFSKLSLDEKLELISLLEEKQRRASRRRFYDVFPDEGPLAYHKYPKHMAFFAAGIEHQERAFISGNRCGKTQAAAYEITAHLTGNYPHWWSGRRLTRPNTWWAGGEDAKTVREAGQTALLGPANALGTGMVPGDLIDRAVPKSGVPEAFDSISVNHIAGGKSRLVFKSYDQGREAWQGAKVDGVWFDEEPPLHVYMEGLTRTMATVPGEANGMAISTFTPLKGLSAVVLMFLPGGKMAGAA